MSIVYRVNRPKVISEVFEDEVVAVNFDTGSYYGMRKTALTIWCLLEEGASAQMVTERLTSVCNGDEENIGGAVSQFLAQLRSHDLITESGVTRAGAAPEPIACGQAPWDPPVLSVYEDMKELLLLDPIHDVDEGGWPARKPDNLP
jgi:hypothetical protein